MTPLFSSIAIVVYLLAAAWLGRQLFLRKDRPAGLKLKLLAFAGLALLLHGCVLYQKIFAPTGLELGFYNALSLMGWVITLMVVLIAQLRPAENLAMVFLPMTALALLLEQVFNIDHMVVSRTDTIGLKVHILLSIGAYGLLAIAAVQALVLALQDYLLRHKHPVQVMRTLPPMQTMEDLLVQLITIGFFLLSLSLATGLMFVHDIMAQHLAHKVALSILAWVLYGWMLLGRWFRGWRGKRLVRWALGGFILLVLSYFGSKLVLELILHRSYAW